MYKKSMCFVLLLSSSFAMAGDEAMPSVQEMWKIIQQQQAEIQALKAKAKVNEEKIEATGEMVEANIKEEGSTHQGSGKSHFGGYGELHYNNLDNKTAGGSDKDEIDFHRFVLFFSHDFTESIRFVSELEVEHVISAGDEAGGVELEQAYIDFDISDGLTAQGGLFLVPVGIINETHEPPSFYGVERNPVEKNILPSTWWEAGAGIHGNTDIGLSYAMYAHSGLKVSAAKNYAIRKGRQKVSEADASDLAYTGRIKWTGVPGLELAITGQYQTDITQSIASENGGSAWLWEAHVDLQKGPFALKALYAHWNLDGSGPESVGADVQKGFYIEPAVKIASQWGVFIRYNQWDNQAGNSLDSEYQQYNYGVNYWPHEDVVVKMDWQDQSTPDGKSELDGFNLGIGYQF